MYLDDIIDSITLDPFTPLFSKTKAIRSSFDARPTIEDDHLKIHFDVPGSKKEDVDVTFGFGNTIKVNAKRSDTGSITTWHYTLSEGWDRDSGDARIEDGVLTIRFSKLEPEKTRKLLIK